MFKKSMMVILACGLGIGLFIGCGGGSSSPSDGGDGNGDITIKTYKSLITYGYLGDEGGKRELIRYDIETNSFDRLKDADGNSIMIAISTNPSHIISAVVHDGVVYFSGFDGQKYKFYTYNFLNKELHVVDEITIQPTMGDLIPVNNAIYFYARSSISKGYELHRYNIDTDKISILTDINPDGEDSDIKYINDVNGVLYFSAYNGSDRELWKYDTATDTAEMIDIYPDNSNSSNLNYIINVDGVLYFGAQGKDNGNYRFGLWKYDINTEELVFCNYEDRISIHLGLNDKGIITEADNIIYFQGRNDSLTDKGYELYKYDITQDKVSLAADINKTTGGDSSSSPIEITEAHGILYFSADDDIHGRELWKLDLTTGQASLAYDINSGGKDSHSNPSALVEVNDVLYFSADDGVNGRELYKCSKEDGCTITKNLLGPASSLVLSENYPLQIMGSTF
jgi:ELWxxDGT repeat protein